MEPQYLKRAKKKAEGDNLEARKVVEKILAEIEAEGESKVEELTAQFDKYNGNVLLKRPDLEAAADKVAPKLRDDIRFAYDNIRTFAQAQKDSLSEFETEILQGLIAGQRCIPVQTAGCYVPGGRYSHIASALMTVTTAQVAGCENIIVCSPARAEKGIPPAIAYTALLCGAHHVLALGGVQAIASMAFGLYGLPKADILVGPGNQFVAEAKRILYGRVGIDMFAGPTDSLILADSQADAEIVAADLVGQAEHGYNSPVWLVTDDAALAHSVMTRVPQLIADLPRLNSDNAAAAWRDYAEVIVCADREAMATIADQYAPEHLTVQAQDLDWWLQRLKCYGSLFLGEETTVAYGDKSSGPNHVLPTSGAAKYTGGLSVHKYMKVVTWQRSSREGSKRVAQATARISRLEGMEGHARTADIRLAKYFADEEFDLWSERG